MLETSAPNKMVKALWEPRNGHSAFELKKRREFAPPMKLPSLVKNNSRIGLLVAAITVFIFRGPYRAILHSVLDDFLAINYLATRLWCEGKNPYDRKLIVQEWANIKSIAPAATQGIQLPYWGNNYPPCYMVLNMPWALMDLGWAYFTFNLVSTFSALLVCWLLLKSVKLSPSSRIFCYSGMLLWSPIHTGIAHLQCSTIAISLAIVSLLMTHNNKPIPASIALGLGLAYKPQDVIPALLVVIIYRRWKICAAALSIVVMITAISLARFGFLGINLITAFLSELHKFANTLSNPSELCLTISGNALLLQCQLNSEIAGVILALIAIAFEIYYFLYLKPDKTMFSTWYVFSLVATLSLLCTYHRFYDAFLLIPLIVIWFSPRLKRDISRWDYYALALLLVVFAVPITAYFHGNLINNKLMLMTVGLHQRWILIAMFVILHKNRSLITQQEDNPLPSE